MMVRIRLAAMVGGVIASCELEGLDLKWIPLKVGDEVARTIPSKLLHIVIADDSGAFDWIVGEGK